MDLKERGLLDDTLVIWGGEFGRTIYSQGALTATDHGRDHHGRCFTAWMAGGGARAGYEHGETDDYCYNVVRDPVHINDLNATILHAMGIDHERFTFPYQGLDQRLTGVEGARVERRLLS
jgi:arylsulfatase A-like enzyme